MSSYKVSSIHSMTPIESGVRIEPKPVRMTRLTGGRFIRTDLRSIGDIEKYNLVIEFQHQIPSLARILK